MSEEQVQNPTEDELEAQLGERFESYAMALPVGGWKPTMVASLMRAFKESRQPGTVKLSQYNLLALTGTRMVAFSAVFDRKRGLVPRDQIIDWPRSDLEGSAERVESTTATIYGDGDVGPNNTTKLVRLTVRAGGQTFSADLMDDKGTGALLDALGVEPV